MDKQNYEDILLVDTPKQYHRKVYLLCEFTSKYNLQEVPDPDCGGVEGFNLVIDLLVDACGGILKNITARQVLAKT